MKLENNLLPSFVSSDFTDQQSQTLLAMSSLMYNAIAQQLTVDKYIFKLSGISLKLCVKARSVASFAERVFHFIKVFNVLQVDTESITEEYINFLSMLDIGECYSLEKTSIKPFISILQLLINIFVPKMCLVELRKSVEYSLRVMQKLYTTKEHILLLKILKNISSLIAHVKDYSATNLKVTMSDCYSSLKSLIQHFNQTKQESVMESILACCDTMHLILYKLYHHSYQEVEAETWKNAMPADVQLFFYKILHTSAAFVEKCEKKCSNCTECDICTSVFQSVHYCTTAAHLYKLSVSKTLYSKNMTSEILARSHHSCASINALKKSKCGMWKEAWIELGGLLYNIGVKLYKQNDMECIRFIHLFIENLIKLENLGSSIITENIFESSLLCLKEMYLNSHQHKKAMAVAAVQVASCRKNTDSAFSEWLRVKLASSEHNTVEKETTVLDALQRNIEYVKQIYPVEIEKSVKIKLLIAELQFYNSRWPSKVALKSAFKQLHELADCLTSAKIGVQIWGMQKSVHEDVFQIMEKLSIQLEQLKEPMETKGFVLACIYFCCYKCKRHNLVEQNINEMKNNVVIPLKPPAAPHEVPSHPSDECDIVTVYEKLNFQTQLKLMKLLDKSVLIFEDVLNSFNEELDGTLKSVDVLGILYQIAHEYRLHFHRINCLRTWLLVLMFAKKTENALAISDSVSSIIEFVNISLDSVRKLLQHADSALNKLREVKTVETLECIVNFHISKSFAYLRIENLQTATEEFHEAQRVYEDLAKLSENCVARARLYYLHSKFLMLPCRYQIIAHDEVPGVKLYQAFRVLRDLYENDGMYHKTRFFVSSM